MSAIISLSIDVTKIDKSKLIDGKKGKYLNVTVSVNDELDNYENNAALYESQSQEERERKDNRNYLGNGRVVWTDGSIKTAKELEGSSSRSSNVNDQVNDPNFDSMDDSLPF